MLVAPTPGALVRITVCLVAVVAVALVAVARTAPSTTTEAPTTSGTATPDATDATSDTPEAATAAEPTPTASPTPDTDVVVMWARGGLPPDVARRAAALPGVVSAVLVRSDTLGLAGSRDAEGVAVDDLEPGWRIPVEVLAVDPEASLEALDPGPTRDAVAALEPGQILLPATSAERRGLTVGGTLDLEDRTGLVVAAVVEDDVLGRAEVFVHVEDAGAVGLDTDGSLRIVHDGTAGPGFASALEALAPADTAVRVVGTRPDEPVRRAPLVLGLPDVKERFGEFAFRDDDADREVRVEPAWVDEHIVVADVPILGNVRCHRDIMEDLAAALQAVVDAGLADTIDPDDYGGCYHARRIGSHSNRLSHHSWGIAIDINVDVSLPGLGPPPDPEVVDAFADHGFRWGGLFLSPDNHHFEWVGEGASAPPPPAGVGHA